MAERAIIRAVEGYLPPNTLDNEQLASGFQGWSAEKITEKTGIRERRIAAPDQCSSDLAVLAAEKLFASGVVRREEIDFVLLCTQTPDYLLPSSSCLVQNRLKLPTSCGALDVNMGCSGFVYGLALAKSLVESALARNVLLLTADTYSKLIHPDDKSVRTLFGDAAAATLISGSDRPGSGIGPFVFGTDGSGAGHLIVPTGGLRQAVVANAPVVADESGNRRTINHLYMNGPEIFNFTIRQVPQAVNELLTRAGKTVEEIDLFFFHQANRYMLDHLRKKLRLPAEKFVMAMEHCGNTVSSSIPIALKEAQSRGQLKPGQRLMLIGFGVGLSWAGCIVQWE